jgi:hypothetical protein
MRFALLIEATSSPSITVSPAELASAFATHAKRFVRSMPRRE